MTDCGPGRRKILPVLSIEGLAKLIVTLRDVLNSHNQEIAVRGADILVDMLIGYGVEVIFGVPGDTNVLSTKPCKRTRARSATSWRVTIALRVTWQTPMAASPANQGCSNAHRAPVPCISLPPVAESNSSSVPVILLTIDIPLPAKGAAC